MQKPKILIWDIETTDMELSVRSYALKSYTKYYHYSTIKRDWSILGAAWKWLNDDHTRCISVNPNDVFNDRHVVEMIHVVLSEADILIGHNADKFDIKKFNARALFYKLPPIPPKQTIDTLKQVRKIAAFSANNLGYLAKYLNIAEKSETPDWGKIMDGCPDELRKMRQYNKDDVISTEALYKAIMPYMPTHPNLNAYNPVRDIKNDPVIVCPRCGNCDAVIHRHVAGTNKTWYHCTGKKGCYSYFKENRRTVRVK